MLHSKPVLGTGRYWCAWPFTMFLLAFVAVTRWRLAPHCLYYFDSANFAYSLERFNPALHQPQPPGYVWFVGLIRLIHLWVPEPDTVLLVAGLLAALAAILLIRMLASDLFRRHGGVLAPDEPPDPPAQ
jgi:hypothetical protein